MVTVPNGWLQFLWHCIKWVEGAHTADDDLWHKHGGRRFIEVGPKRTKRCGACFLDGKSSLEAYRRPRARTLPNCLRNNFGFYPMSVFSPHLFHICRGKKQPSSRVRWVSDDVERTLRQRVRYSAGHKKIHSFEFMAGASGCTTSGRYTAVMYIVAAAFVDAGRSVHLKIK